MHLVSYYVGTRCFLFLKGFSHNYVELHCVLYLYREQMWLGGNYET